MSRWIGVRVRNGGGSVAGARVDIQLHHPLNQGFVGEKRTDGQGTAYFRFEGQGPASIFLNGSKAASYVDLEAWYDLEL